MSNSATPRRNKQLLLWVALAIVALVVISTIVNRARQQALQADDPNAQNITLDEGQVQLTNVLVKVVDATGAPKAAFVDAFVDANKNCQNDPTETGTLDETQDDGTAVLQLASNQPYVLRATLKEADGEGTTAINVGTVIGNSCAQDVRSANTDPVIIQVK